MKINFLPTLYNTAALTDLLVLKTLKKLKVFENDCLAF